ncbi:MAG: hypothetical protein ACSLE0_23395 [Chitinophagaceae bacterium]
MAIFTVTIGTYISLPPSQIGDNTIYINYNETYVFTEADFTTNTIPQYVDPEGDAVSTVKIIGLPSVDLLWFGLPVILNDEIPLADIINGDLTYVGDIAEIAGYSDTFTFDIADVGSLTYSGLTGNIYIIAAEAINLPPDIVGDGSATIDYGATLIFTSAMFTTGTTPVYSDPEGDNPKEVKILTLPNVGILYYNGIPVVINQVITVANIDLGLLTYVSDLVDVDGDSQSFTFAVSDVGSGQFVS